MVAQNIQAKMASKGPALSHKNSIYTPAINLDANHKDDVEFEEKIKRCRGKTRNIEMNKIL